MLGNDLLSRRVAPTVPSALEGLTSVFGKGTGVSPPPLSPNDGDYTEPLGEAASAYRARRRRARRLLIFLASAVGRLGQRRRIGRVSPSACTMRASAGG